MFNKADLAPEEAARQVKLRPGSVAISAVTGVGLEQLLTAVSDRLRAAAIVTELLVPYDRGDVLAAIHREGEVLSSASGDEGIRVRARLSRPSAGRLAEFLAGSSEAGPPVGAAAIPSS